MTNRPGAPILWSEVEPNSLAFLLRKLLTQQGYDLDTTSDLEHVATRIGVTRGTLIRILKGRVQKPHRLTIKLLIDNFAADDCAVAAQLWKSAGYTPPAHH